MMYFERLTNKNRSSDLCDVALALDRDLWNNVCIQRRLHWHLLLIVLTRQCQLITLSYRSSLNTLEKPYWKCLIFNFNSTQ